MSRQLSYREALNEAMTQEMRRDSNVFTYGIDVADHKRIFDSTKGLAEEFGTARCFSTPLSEDAMTGFGLGAAINGMRPVHVHMRVDFFVIAMNQLINMIASYHYGTSEKQKFRWLSGLLLVEVGGNLSSTVNLCIRGLPTFRASKSSCLQLPKTRKACL